MSAALGTISGDTLLFAPPVGQFAAVSYVLTDGNNPVYDATFSLLSAPEGVSLAGNRLILNGSTLKSGDVSLSATSGDGLVTATLSVSISNTRLYFDAESNTTGEALTAVLPKLLNSSEAGANIIQLVGEAGQQVVKTEANGNQYFYCDDDSNIVMNPKWAGTDSNKTQLVTVSGKIKKHGDYVPPGSYYTLIAADDSVLTRMSVSGTEVQPAWAVLNRYDENGRDAGDSGAVSTGVVLDNNWTEFKLRMDYAKRTYSLYLDGMKVCENYTMSGSAVFLSQLYMKTSFDDLAVFSGDEVVSQNGTWQEVLGGKKTYDVPANLSDVVIQAKVRTVGEGVLRFYDGEKSESLRFTPSSTQWEDLTVIFKNKNLSVVCGLQQLEERGVEVIEKITSIEFANLEVSDVSIGNQWVDPMLLNPNIYIDGETVGLDYIYFAPGGEKKGTVTVDWYVSDRADGLFATYLESGETGIAKPADNQYISCDITFGSEIITTTPQLVADLDVLVQNERKNGIGANGVTLTYVDAEGERHWGTIVKDWTGYNQVVFRMNSQVNTGRVFEPVFYSTSGYYYTYFPVNWSQNHYKDVVVSVGEGSGIEHSGGVTQWSDVRSIAFWTSLTTEQKETGSLTDDETDTYCNIEKTFIRKQSVRENFWKKDYILNAKPRKNTLDYGEKIIPQSHPRLLLTDRKITQLKQDVKQNAYLKKSYERLVNEVAAQVQAGPLTVASSAESGKLAKGAFLYNLTPTEELKNWIWTSAENLSKTDVSWNPDSASYLSVGDTARSVALAYDWMYNHWTEGQRRIVRNGLVKNALAPSISTLRSGANWAGHGRGNWIQSIVSGLGMTALSICDNEDYKDLCNEVLDRSICSLGYGMRDVEENGAYAEGVSYWHYAMDTFFPFEAALDQVCGSNYGLLDKKGIEETGYFPIMMTGVNGNFNFCDASITYSIHTAAFYRLSAFFDNPDFGSYHYEHTKEAGCDYMSMILYDTKGYGTFRENMPGYRYFPGNTESFVMRHNWEDSNAAYLGFKGGNNKNNHVQLDIGTFVYDYFGIRWFNDLGRDSYTYSSKWELYRNRAEGNNCLVVNPDETADQNTAAHCKVTDYKIKNDSGYGIVDMTEAYSTEGLTSAKRGFAMLDGYKTLLIQDEFTAESPAEIYSFLHTQATVNIAADKQSATLTRSGKTMYVHLLSDCGAELTVMDAQLMKLMPTAEQWSNAGYRKLSVKADGVMKGTFALVVTPEPTSPVTEIMPLLKWQDMRLGLSVEPAEFLVNGSNVPVPYVAEHGVETLKATFDVKNGKTGNQTLWVMVACYENDQLKEVKKEMYPVEKGFDDTIEITYTNTRGANAEFSVMVWNSDLQPLTEKAVIKRRKIDG